MFITYLYYISKNNNLNLALVIITSSFNIIKLKNSENIDSLININIFIQLNPSIIIFNIFYNLKEYINRNRSTFYKFITKNFFSVINLFFSLVYLFLRNVLYLHDRTEL